MELESLLQTASDAWTRDDVDRVSAWLCRPEQLNKLVRIVYGFVGGLGRRDLDLAEEITSQVLTHLWQRSYATYDPGRSHGSREPFWRWICVAARNKTHSVLGHERRRKRWEKEAVEQASRSSGSWKAVVPPEESDAALAAQRLPETLARLPPLYREAIEFRMQGVSHEEAAERSQSPCTGMAMRARLVRARRELRRLMDGQQGACHDS
ncbi:MAG TPA: sigma-70 family RNA polymerase sigma factor [Gemmataceae bacterium]|nr:sigma-70 family RNA polymerase sigma factor [Gemmataceae bacterium]